MLLHYGGNPHQSNRKGETPLKVANSPSMVNLLLGKTTYASSEESSTGEAPPSRTGIEVPTCSHVLIEKC